MSAPGPARCPRSAPPFPRRAPGGAGRPAARARRRGRRERGRTRGPQPPTARLAGIAAPNPQCRSLRRSGRPGPPPSTAALARGPLTLHVGRGYAARRPRATPHPPAALRPAPPRGPGRWRRPARALAAPRSPPAPPRAPDRAGATFLKGQVAGIRIYLGPRFGLPSGCPSFRGETRLQ